MKLLFVCSRNKKRSPTAEAVFSGIDGIETASAGTAPDAEEKVTPDLLEWADIVFVMEPSHRKRLDKYAGCLKGKRVVTLNIKDDYEFMDEALVDLLWAKVPLTVTKLTQSRK